MGSESRLTGRAPESSVLRDLVAAVRTGDSGALVVHGEPGIGKTALLDDLRHQTQGVRFVHGAGVESEQELAFAGLHKICAEIFAEGVDRLPEHQRNALRLAFGEVAGGLPDRFLVGLAVLDRLSDAAEDEPLICVVDDAQWLDSASLQTLAFVARRLRADRVGMVFAVREVLDHLTGLPELRVGGLAAKDARRLLSATTPISLEEPVREHLIAEAAGNPLALLELPRSLTATELAGWVGARPGPSVSARVEAGFQKRVAALPADTRTLLLAAAAEPTGDTLLLWRAAAELGIGSEAAAPAEAAGLVRLGSRVVFRHPLVRSAVYEQARTDERRRVHAALARASAGALDPERHAWHRALAAAAPDEEVAVELERAAARADARGGLAASAAMLERAVALTPDEAVRGRRAVAAAQAKLTSGAVDAAVELARIAEITALDELQRARLDLVRARIAFAVNRGTDAPRLLLKAAERLKTVDTRLSRNTYMEALQAAGFAGRLGKGGAMAGVARAARKAPPAAEPPLPQDFLLDADTALLSEGYAAGAPLLRRTLAVFRQTPEVELRWLGSACHGAIALWDVDAWLELSERQVVLARRAGALPILRFALFVRALPRLLDGDLKAGLAIVDEINAILEVTGITNAPYMPATVEACAGRADTAVALIRSGLEDVANRGEGFGETYFRWLSAFLANAQGRYGNALEYATVATGYPDEAAFYNLAMVESIEAAVRSGETVRARSALETLRAMTCASGTPWALGIQARSDALLADGDAAELHYRAAISHLGGAKVRVELARAHLVFGEWLRRAHRRVESRAELRTAHDLFTSFGFGAFAERTSRELAAAGEHVRTQSAKEEQLTAQEGQIARLAASGHSNRDIGAMLFISHRTVGYHLGKVFSKLNVGNRAQLHEALTSDGHA